MKNNDEFGYTYAPYPGEQSAVRAEYDFFAANSNRAKFLDSLGRRSFHLVDEVNRLFVVDKSFEGYRFPRLELNTEIFEALFQYAAEGVPGFLLEDDKEMAEEALFASDAYDSEFGVFELWHYFEAVEGLHCLSNGFEEVDQRQFAVNAVVNKFCARLKLDTALYKKDYAWLSIAEVSHLAGMKTKSVRNAVRKEIKKVSHTKSGMALIRSDHALDWLVSRRKFVPSYLLKTAPCIDALMAIRQAHGGHEAPDK